MNGIAVPATESPVRAAVPVDAPPRVNLALIGCGSVGSVFVELLQAWTGIPIQLIGLANSRVMQVAGRGIAPQRARDTLARASRLTDLDALASAVYDQGGGIPVIVDATASAAVALRHETWLKAGLHVITANKIAASNGLSGTGFGTQYGDSATVGAGLPVLHALRRLRAAGDRIKHIEAILSGSLACLFHALQAGEAFSSALARAREQGYTEPDPRADLRGWDVARKLAVVGQAAGLGHVALPEPESLLPEWMTKVSEPTFWRTLPRLDTSWRNRVNEVARRGRVLRYIAAIGAGGRARIGLQQVAPSSPLGATSGADNVVAIHSDAYHREPLVIRGPGAGPLVTARALLADIAEVIRVGAQSLCR